MAILLEIVGARCTSIAEAEIAWFISQCVRTPAMYAH